MRLRSCDLRIERLRQLLVSRGKKGILLESAASLSWLTGGRAHVGIAGNNGVFEILVTMDDVFLLTSNIECERLLQEEIGSDFVKPCVYPWQNPSAVKIPDDILREGDAANDLRNLRTQLTDGQAEEMRRNCADAAKLMTGLILGAEPGHTEMHYAGQMAAAAYGQGFEPIVVLAAGDERLLRYRHPVSTEEKVNKILMLSLGCRRKGMYTSITRFVSFGGLSDGDRANYAALAAVTAEAYSAVRPGVQSSVIYHTLAGAYEKNGLTGQINLHHQGGLGGFQARESKITDRDAHIVRVNEVYALNPSANGWKCEDMLLIGESGNEILTVTPELPSKTVQFGNDAWQISWPYEKK